MPLYDVNANPIPDELLPSSQPIDPDNPPQHAGHHDLVAQQLSDITRRQEILKLRIQGYSHQQIADKLGGTPQSIEAIIRIAINKIDKLSGKNVEKLKQRELRMELLRLDEFLLALWPIIDGTDHRSKVTKARAIEIALKIGERRAKLLGLDQPEKQQVLNLNAEVEGLSADQLEARAREVGITLVDLPQEPLPLPAPLDALPHPVHSSTTPEQTPASPVAPAETLPEPSASEQPLLPPGS